MVLADEPPWLDQTDKKHMEAFNAASVNGYMYSAMCVWEHVLETRDTRFRGIFSDLGFATARDCCVYIAIAAEFGWNYIDANGIDPQTMYPDSFDWDYIPWFLQTCVNDDLSLKQGWVNILLLAPKPGEAEK